MKLTNHECSIRALRVWKTVPPEIKKKTELKVFGIPRGGVPAAYLFCSMATNIIHVETAEEADILIDDIVDSGATKNKYFLKYPNKHFFALVDKLLENITEWIIFPWEQTDSYSATDIPLRLLQYIGEDTAREGLQDTPKRFLKAWKHYTSGYGKDPYSLLKQFTDGGEDYNEMVLIKKIPVFSHCEHHMAPFYGIAHVAYIPNGKIVGLSKIPRLVDMFMRRLQVQERLTNQISEAIQQCLEPLGVAVVLECYHTCMISRGVQIAGSVTVTSSVKGVFDTEPSARSEFFSLINK